MSETMGKLCGEGFIFFSRANRLISHELKNVLAIISETLGLLDELVALWEKGRTLEPGKLQGLTSSILEDVTRANGIIRSMNRLAHSVDEFVTETDVAEVLGLALELSRLDSASKRINMYLETAGEAVISTCPFFLHGLLFRIMHYAMRRGGPEREIRISLETEGGGCTISFGGIAPMGGGEFPTEREQSLVKALSGRITMDVASGTLRVVLPRALGRSPLHALSTQV